MPRYIVQKMCSTQITTAQFAETSLAVEPSQKRMHSLRRCLNVLLPLSVIGNFTTFQWILPKSGPMEYLLGVLGKSTVIKAT